MGLRVLSWRRLGRPDGPGLRQIRCEPDSHDARWCPSCGAYARVRSSWLRTLAHVPYGDDAVHLLVRVRRYECVPCRAHARGAMILRRWAPAGAC